jgi:hypothetical protein
MLLSFTSFSMLRKVEMCSLYEIIFNTFKKEFKRGQEKIRVPVTVNQSGNEIEKQWHNVVQLKSASELVEEIFAVRSSLLPLRDKGPIANWLWQKRVRGYKEAYDEAIYGFKVVYEVFDSIAEKIGGKAAIAMIYNALETFNPDGAFCDLILEMLLRNQSDQDFISNLSVEQTDMFFRKILEDIDKINLSYRVISGMQAVALILQEGRATEYIEDTFPTFTPNVYSEQWKQLGGLDSDGGVWRSIYFSKDSYLTLYFAEAVKHDRSAIQEVKYGNFAIALESIRQQLTKGIGLLCPFWIPSHPCCSSRNRAFLEKVWSGTCPNSDCKLWERLGCLATSSGVRGT